MTNLDAPRAALNPLLTAAGKIDKRAVMLDAHRQFRQMQPHGWNWPPALRFAWARARAMKARVAQAAQPGRPRLVLMGPPPTPEGVAVMLDEALTGRAVVPEALARAEARFAAADAARRTARP